MDVDLSRIDKNLVRLTLAQERSNSLKWTFARGIISGLGVVVGSTVLVAVILYILSLFDTTPVIGNYISRIVDIVNMKSR